MIIDIEHVKLPSAKDYTQLKISNKSTIPHDLTFLELVVGVEN